MITISLFYCCEHIVVNLMNIWMIGKSSMKRRYSKKNNLYSHLNMESVTDADYVHTKRGGKNLEVKSLGEYHDLYVQSDTLLLADIFENFRNICLKIYEHGPAKFLSAFGLTWQATLKRLK